MLLIRKVEEEIANRYSLSKMRCPAHLSIGQEAVSAAFSSVANVDDYAVSTHRGHAHFLAKGGSLNKMIAELYGKSTGCSKGKGGSMHLMDLDVSFMGTSAIVGNSIPIGVGLAYASKLQKKRRISYVFLGDGAIEEGVFFESLNFACLKRLPVVFICENNLYSVYSPLSVRQPKGRSIAKLSEAIGATVFTCNGNNVRQSYEIISESTDLARIDSVPVFAEFFTYRHREHCGPNHDDDLEYRNKNDVQTWLSNDPIKEQRAFLIDNFGVNPDEFSSIHQDVEKQIHIAFDFAESSPFPDQNLAYADVYSENVFLRN